MKQSTHLLKLARSHVSHICSRYIRHNVWVFMTYNFFQITYSFFDLTIEKIKVFSNILCNYKYTCVNRRLFLVIIYHNSCYIFIIIVYVKRTTVYCIFMFYLYRYKNCLLTVFFCSRNIPTV